MRYGKLMLSMMVVGAAALAAVPAAAETAKPSEPSGTEMAMEGLEKLMRGLEQMIEELPRYDLPEITANGDIILRRVDPPPVDRRHPLLRQPKPGEGVDL